MLSIMDIFTQVCTNRHEPPLIAVSRQKDVMTALKYLASAYGSTPDKLVFTPELEATYRPQVRTYLNEQQKGRSTIRNTLQYLAQLWKAFHTIDHTPPVPQQGPLIPSFGATKKHFNQHSPYRHVNWLMRHHYTISAEQWPVEISARWATYERSRIHHVRQVTLDDYAKNFGYYVSYQLMSPEARLEKLPDEAQAKLSQRRHAKARDDMTTHPRLTSWDELFDPTRLNSFITWSAWRCWRWHDEALKEKTPHRPSTQGLQILVTMEQVAKLTEHPRYAEVSLLLQKLPSPTPMHDKKSPMHQFDLSELEGVALALITEARRIRTWPSSRHPGSGQAVRFQLGLMLQLMWRNPMRARNWCEAILGLNLKQEDGHWRWHFAGDEMKIGKRGTQVNVFEPDVPEEVVPHLEEFLTQYRPKIPNAAHERHVFLTQRGTSLKERDLTARLKIHVARYTGKNIYTHLLRSLFSTYHLTHGMDVNSVAYAMNDTPASVLHSYNLLMADKHRPIIHEANQRALANGNGHTLTPPVISIPPKIPKPLRTDPDQVVLI